MSEGLDVADDGLDDRDGGEDVDRSEHGLLDGDAVGESAAEDADEAALRTVDHRVFSTRFTDARIAQSERGEPLEPGGVRLDDARLPWAENPLNPAPERYPTDARAQIALEEHFATHGFDRETLRLINDGDDRLNRTDNCGDCARAVVSCLDGQPLAARPLLPLVRADGVLERGEDGADMESYLGRPGELARNRHGRLAPTYDTLTREQIDPDVDAGFARLQQELSAAGPGAHAVVALTWKPPEHQPPGTGAGGHWIVAANVDDRVLFLDAQAQELGTLESDFMADYRVGSAEMSWIRSTRR